MDEEDCVGTDEIVLLPKVGVIVDTGTDKSCDCKDEVVNREGAVVAREGKGVVVASEGEGVVVTREGGVLVVDDDMLRDINGSDLTISGKKS